MLRVECLSKRFDGNAALREVSFTVRPGELTSVIGPNGAGKTTLLDALSGLISVDSGRISLGDEEVSSFPPWTRSSRWIDRTFQRPKLTAALTAEENIMLHVRNQRGARIAAALSRRRGWHAQEAQIRDRARDLLERVGLASYGDTACGQLSFGQAKLISVCGVLLSEMPILLLDEPFTGLDPSRIEIVSRCLLDQADRGRLLLFVEHNLSVVSRIARRTLAFDRGTLIADASPSDVLTSDAVRVAYLR
jgi:branched-chain amino acid transport system ATP-binding protein